MIIYTIIVNNIFLLYTLKNTKKYKKTQKNTKKIEKKYKKL